MASPARREGSSAELLRDQRTVLGVLPANIGRGTGESRHSRRRVSSDLRIPRLGSDTLGRTIRKSEAFTNGGTAAYRIGYDVLWRLCQEVLQSGVAVIVDTNMGWPDSWDHLDAVRETAPTHHFLPLILRCPREVCIERIRERHLGEPTYYGPPEEFMTERSDRLWEFLEQLDRPEIRYVDAARSEDEVYQEIRQNAVRLVPK